MGWRQADTQVIARHLAEDFRVLEPEVDWGGSGPYAVESEAPVYAALVSAVLRVAPGQPEWPGRLLSLLAVLFTAPLFYRTLRRRYGAGPAALAVAFFVASPAALFAGTTVQPDSLALLLTTVAFVAFLAYAESPGDPRHARRVLGLAVVATALAGLTKPTALHIGVAEALLLLLIRPRALRSVAPWVGWGLALAVVGAWLIWAAGIHARTGLSFGTVSGGDSKFPAARDLLRPGRYWDLARVSLFWGIGLPGALAGAWLVVRRRVQPAEWALFAASALLLLVSMRYSSQEWLGSHYHLPTTLLGAWLLAHAASDIAPSLTTPLLRRAAAAVALLALVAWFATALDARRTYGHGWAHAEIALGEALRPHLAPGDLVVVRSRAPARDQAWGTANNYEDPRLLYVAGARGWVLPSDERWAPETLADLAERGARYYADPTGGLPAHPGLLTWLTTHAQPLAAGPSPALWRLPQAPTLVDPGLSGSRERVDDAH
ncbi:MAG: glycosyltransferase family 39 protein [Deltaproteobacteria bacterium]|nr:glycosyltransferase family 39 protein [Deltaproteobacteria bacterium]MCB9789244.1 glycosyltransferase family 39 protein [Deltaproteobacteria bacterium]